MCGFRAPTSALYSVTIDFYGWAASVGKAPDFVFIDEFSDCVS